MVRLAPVFSGGRHAESEPSRQLPGLRTTPARGRDADAWRADRADRMKRGRHAAFRGIVIPRIGPAIASRAAHDELTSGRGDELRDDGLGDVFVGSSLLFSAALAERSGWC
jgi:hypothetical protein